MEYTGERCIPGKKGLELLELEHRVRYALATQYAKDRHVLDLGSGSGYGAGMIAEVAETVLGVDVSEEAVQYAQNAYSRANATFLVADLCADDFVERISGVHPKPFGCVTAFEVIEHVKEPLKVFRAVASLLEKDGVFLVSTPNIDYAFDLEGDNPHHVVEYSLDTFSQLLRGQFRQVEIAGQTVHMLSAVGSVGDGSHLEQWRTYGKDHVKFFVAICSNRKKPVENPAAALLTSDAHLKILQMKLKETRQDQAVKSQRIRLMEQFLNELTQAKSTGLAPQSWVEIQEVNRKLAERAAAAESHLKNVEDRLVKLEAEKKTIESRLDDMTKLKTRVDTLDERAGQADKRAGEVDTRVAGVDKRVGEVDGRVAGVDKRVGEVDGRVAGVDKRVGEVDGRVAGVDKRVGEVDGRVAGVDKRVGEVDGRVAGVDKRVGEVDGRVAGVDKRVGEVDGRVAGVDKRVGEVDGRVAGVDKRVGEVDGRVAGVDKRVGEVDGRVAGVDKRVGEVDGRVAGVDKRVGEVDTRVAGVDKRVAGVDKRVGEVDGRVDSVDIRIGDVDARVDSVDTRIADVDARVDSVEVHVGEVDGRVAGVDKRVAVVGKRVEEVNGRANAVETRVSDLHTYVKDNLDQILRALAELREANVHLQENAEQAHRTDTELRKAIVDLRNHPAMRRLLRLRWPGLKFIGLLGRFGRKEGIPPNPSIPVLFQPTDKPDMVTGYAKILQDTLNLREEPEISVLSELDAARIRSELQTLPQATRVSIVMPTYNRAHSIRAAIDSILLQSYNNWELIVIDDGSTDNTRDVVEEYQRRNTNIRLIRNAHRGVSAARNAGLQEARGDLVAYLDSDNRWLPDYLLFMVHALGMTGRRTGYCALKILDHDNNGAISYRKRHYVRENLLKNNYIDINIFVHQREVADKLGGFDTSLRRWVDYDLILRYTKHHDPIEVPIALCEYNKHAKLKQITAEESPAYKFKVLGKHLIQWHALEDKAQGRVAGCASIVIPVFNRGELLEKCVESIQLHTKGVPFEIVIVDNGSDRATKDILKALAAKHRAVRLVTNYENFFFSLGNNIGVASSTGEFVVLLNNDTLVTPGWLDALIAPLRENPEVGAVGAKLLYEDGTVQHAGLVFSNRSKIPYHLYKGVPSDDACVNKRRKFQALTGACLAFRAAEYIKLRGLDGRYANGGEDLDLCFRIRLRLGKDVLYVPESVVYHLEGKTEGRNKFILYNRQTFVEHWGKDVKADDLQYYAEDGFRVMSYEKPGNEPDGETAAYVPKLVRADANGGPAAEPPPIPFERRAAGANAGRSALRVGFVSIWHIRGVSLLTKQYADTLEFGGLETHIFARWESEKFSNSGAVFHPRVVNGGDDPAPETIVHWARDNRLDMVIFMEVHPKDWKRVHALRKAGIFVMCVEHLDILRKEVFDQYGCFDSYLFSTFYSQRVFLEKFPSISTLVLPHGVPGGLTEPMLADNEAVSGDLIRGVHIAGWGGMKNRKGTDIVIQAFDLAGASNMELHLYTQAPMETYGEDCLRILRTNSRIQVHQGTIANIFDAYRGMDLLLWPSRREGLGLPIVEALACGIPVLISDGYNMKQWIIPGEHGLVCPARAEHGRMFLPEMEVDVPTFANMLRTIAENPEELRRLKQNVRRDRHLWIWDWQKRVFCEQLRKILLEPGYRPPADCSYLPSEILAFERKRAAAFGETCPF